MLSLTAAVLGGSLPVALADDAGVLQLLEKRCANCHKDDETPVLHGGISLTDLRKDADAVKEIVTRVNLPADDKKRMPKSKGAKGGKDYHAPLSKEEITLITTLTETPAAAKPDDDSKAGDEDPKPAAIPAGFNTHCPIDTLQEADPNLFLEYSGKKVYFCCRQCMKLWGKQANYVIKARGVEHMPQFKGMEEDLGLETINLLPQRHCPVREGALILPGAPSVQYNGKKLFLFAKEEADEWKQDPKKFAAHVKADGSVPAKFSDTAAAEEKPGKPEKPEAPSVPASTPAGGADLAKSVLQIFEARCVACHGRNATEPRKFQTIDDLAKLRVSPLVNLQLPEDSKLFTVLKDEEMPRPTKAEKAAGKSTVAPLTAAETATILSWIRAGAPVPEGAAEVAKTDPATPASSEPPMRGSASQSATPARKLITPAEEITAAMADLQTVDREDQPDIRYVSLAVAHNNAALRDDDLENLRRGTRKMLNSLSMGPRIVKFEEVGPGKTLLRVRLTDLGWDAALWEKVASHFPLAVDTGVSGALGSACRTTVPVMRADYLAATATRPPLYHDIMRLPKTQTELERKLGVDVADNLKRGQAMRAAFSKSGISNANRLVERHDLGRGGSYWLSYDFKSSHGHGSLLQFPLGPKAFPDGSAPLMNGSLAFEHDGGEFVFTLPNGLHGYYVSDVLGNRLDGAAPTAIVGDRDNITGRVEISNGLSCIICHEKGLKDAVPKDEVRALAATFGAEEQRMIERLHPEQAVFDAKLKEDISSYAVALKAAGAEPLPGHREPVGQLARLYEEEVALEHAAAELGLAPKDFLEKLDAIPSLTDIRLTFRRGGAFQREHFNDRFPEIVRRLTNDTVRPFQPIVAVGASRLSNLRPVPVLLTLDKKNYREGEIPKITLETAETCHVRLLYQDARGDITVLFPNQFISDDSVRAGKSQLLPVPNPKRRGDEVAIEIFGGDDGKVFGTERFIVVATDQPFTDTTSLLAAAREAFDKTKVPFATEDSKSMDLAMTKAARAISRPSGGSSSSDSQARVGFSAVTVTTRPK